MIKNTSGLAVQPCRLHERFYYHARLLYYILRQKARGFFDAGGGGPCGPLFSLCLPGGVLRGRGPQHLPMQALRPAPGGDLCGAGSPSTSRCRRSALHPGEFFAGRQSQPPTMRGVPPLHSPERALRPAPRPTFSRRESRQRYARNLLVPGPPAKGASPPLIPRPCALAVLVEGVQGLRHPRGAARQRGPIRGLEQKSGTMASQTILSIYAI